jgi:hypothetical protein
VRGVESFCIISGHHGDLMLADRIRKLFNEIRKHIGAPIEQRAVELDVREAAEDWSGCGAGACNQRCGGGQPRDTGMTGAVSQHHHDRTRGFEPAVHHEFVAWVTHYQQGRPIRQGPVHDRRHYQSRFNLYIRDSLRS